MATGSNVQSNPPLISSGRPCKTVPQGIPERHREDLVFDVQLEAFRRVSQRPLRTGSCRAEYRPEADGKRQ